MEDTQFTVDAWGNRPFGSKRMPWHMIMGLVQNSKKYPDPATATAGKPFVPPADGNKGLDSECFTFDYENEAASDPAGCRPFTASFKPLQKLRTCIVERIDKDSMWTERFNKTLKSEDGSETLDYVSWCKQAKWSDVYYPGTKIVFQKNVLCDPVFDSKRRALEMMKFVLFKMDQIKSKNVTFEGLWKAVIKKIHFTVTWQRGKDSLAEETATSIATDCFHIRDDSDSKEEAARLRTIRKCLSVMYDKAEIAGHGISDAIVKFQGVPNKNAFEYAYYGNEAQELHQRFKMPVAPLCGRLALASIAKFTDAKYELATRETFNKDRTPAFDNCLDVRHSNCRKAYFCWESALNRVCGIHPKCCPGSTEEAKQETHEDCASNPDGKFQLLNHGSSRFMPTGEMFGFKGRCRSQLGTAED